MQRVLLGFIISANMHRVRIRGRDGLDYQSKTKDLPSDTLYALLSADAPISVTFDIVEGVQVDSVYLCKLN